MYAVTSMPLESRTRATLRSAEFGFLGVIVLTWRQTPRFCGQPCTAGCFGLLRCGRRGLRTSWLIVGISTPEAKRRHPGRGGVAVPDSDSDSDSAAEAQGHVMK